MTPPNFGKTPPYVSRVYYPRPALSSGPGPNGPGPPERLGLSQGVTRSVVFIFDTTNLVCGRSGIGRGVGLAIMALPSAVGHWSNRTPPRAFACVCLGG